MLQKKVFFFSLTITTGESFIPSYYPFYVDPLRNPGTVAQFLGDPDFPRLGLDYFKDDRIRLFQYLFTLYCKLEFTKLSDRSVAISGLLKRLSRTFKSRVDYGISWRYFTRSILWQARVSGGLSRIDYANDRFVPSWSWMAYSGEIGYLDVPFARVEWLEDIYNPFAAESQEGICDVFLVARARLLTVGRLDLADKIILDVDIWNTFEGDQWKCITVGREKGENTNASVPHYTLIIRPSSAGKSPGVYERIGVGILTPIHFSTEANEIRLT